MAYTTQVEMEKLIPLSMLISLSNDLPGASDVEDDVINEVIAQADKEIDAYLVMVMALPLVTTPPLIQDLSTKIAIWNLHLRKYFQSDIWENAYKRCISLLTKIAEGKLSIGTYADGTQADIANEHCIETRHQKFKTHDWRHF